jgi:hypothetical protein
MKPPPITRVAWPDARRIISSRYPPVDLFEDIADPADWDLLLAAETKSNPRIAESVGRLDLVPVERRVVGPGASYVMAPFVHVSVDWAGRFHDGIFGAYYAANRFQTAVAETAYHKAKFCKATNQTPGWIGQMRELVGAIDNAFHDLRKSKSFKDCLDPESYLASQALARRLRAAGSNGVVYPSVRDPKGAAIAAFWPNVIDLPKQGRHLSYSFDGTRIDLVRDDSSGAIWRLEPRA